MSTVLIGCPPTEGTFDELVGASSRPNVSRATWNLDDGSRSASSTVNRAVRRSGLVSRAARWLPSASSSSSSSRAPRTSCATVARLAAADVDVDRHLCALIFISMVMCVTCVMCVTALAPIANALDYILNFVSYVPERLTLPTHFKEYRCFRGAMGFEME